MDIDVGFGDLVQQAQQLTADMDSGMRLPRIERNLTQLRDAAVRMAAHVPLVSQDSANVNASVLLGSRGFDVQKVSQKLESLSSAKTFEPLEPVRDTDIYGFLKNERENALLTAIEQTRKNTLEEAEQRHWETMENEWEREKQKILNALVGSGQADFDFSVESEQSILSENINMQGRTMLDDVEMAYSRQIYMYNEQVIQGGMKPSLVNLCAEMASTLDDQNVSDLWSVVQHMTDVPVSTSDNIVKTRSSRTMKTAFVSQALKYLEKSYVKYITTMVYSNLQKAQLGGIPGTYNLVRSFLNVHLQQSTPGLEDGTVENHPVWAMIYYCLRCGDLSAARQVMTPVQQHLEEFPRFFQEYMTSEDHRLSTNSEREIRLKYKSSIRNSTDPYKRACYCVIGHCDQKDDHTDVIISTDDYLWLKLHQLHVEDEDGDELTEDRLTLTQLQVMLLEEYGESHFHAYQQPYLYFRVLFLSGQFEAAIEFLSRIDRLRCHTVHVALVLYEMGLLLTPHSIQAQLLSRESSDPDPLRRLNFARLIMMYTRKFEVTDPREALQYFYFLRDLKTYQGDNLFMSCVSELVLETREFDMLLGQLNKDGSRRPGVIDKFNLDTDKIIELVARDTENKGLLEDAVRLYDLAQNTEKVLELMNKLLTQVLSQPPAPQSNKDRLKQLALAIAQRYRELGQEGSRHTTSTFHLLLDLMTFFDLYHTNKYEQACSVIQELNLLPFKVEDVEQKVNAFRSYSDEIRRSLPDILLATMTILYTQYRNTKTAGSPLVGILGKVQGGGKQTYINYLRSQAQALIKFAGMLPYRMPGDTNARLVQIEVLMN
ncbi:hypothetical protein LSH36_721g01052 [Paralvinella palmiformis]|uniref:Nuclear pore protein n=1 Tax=Paralvinella palmiformis TaxID=53620 RepID=A0AAD9J1L9_9ANNE|nr:hypothetical protein LSH36_721g01052 [Paralvinella palmiformis]